MNWIYGGSFLLSKDDYNKEDDADWLSTQDSEEVPSDHEPELSEQRINLDTGSDVSDNEHEVLSSIQIANKTNAPNPLDTLTLSKIYAVAEFLEMDKLRNEVIELLGMRLGDDMEAPGQALTYAFKRCGADSPLRKLLIEFTACSAPVLDLLQDSSFDATSELWRALVEELTRVRGADVLSRGDWAQHFQSTVSEYCVRTPS